MSLDKHLEPDWVDDDYSDEEWEAAEAAIRARRGWPEGAEVDPQDTEYEVRDMRAEARLGDPDRLYDLRREEGL